MNINFEAQLIVNGTIMIVGIIYWLKVEFRQDLITIGFIAGALESLGKVFGQIAFIIGPAGPAGAILMLQGLELSIYTAIKEKKVPVPLELAGIVLSLFGLVVIVAPGVFKMIFCCRKQK
jgi:hypothetical protein